MRLFVALTDWDWFRFLRAQPHLDEVNFWLPSAGTGFAALAPGEALLFKLHAPRRRIAGVGWFEGFCQLPLAYAWSTFGAANGAPTLAELHARLRHYRRTPAVSEWAPVGCVLLRDPEFLPEDDWIPEPSGWSREIVRGKGYDTETEPGRTLWDDVQRRLQRRRLPTDQALDLPAVPVAFRQRESWQRLGQGGFRMLVTDAYASRCAVTEERVLPVLEACHIQPATQEGPHDIRNGLLLRRDLHSLFDRGYIGIDPGSRRVIVSAELREDWENGRAYYELAGREVRPPRHHAQGPAREFLEWHRDALFRG